MVEAVRVGYITARDRKQHAKWVRHRDRPKPGGVALTGAALEQAVARVARMFPDNVIHQTAAA